MATGTFQDKQRCIEILHQLEKKAKGKKQDFPVLPEIAAEFTDSYLTLNSNDKSDVNKLVEGKTGLLLISFSGYFAAKAIDEKSPRWLERALTLHAIEGFRYDSRENIRRLVLIFHAGEKLGIDLNDLCIRLNDWWDNRVKEQMMAFFRRDRSLNSLEAVGMSEVIVNERTRFVPLEPT